MQIHHREVWITNRQRDIQTCGCLKARPTVSKEWFWLNFGGKIVGWKVVPKTNEKILDLNFASPKSLYYLQWKMEALRRAHTSANLCLKWGLCLNTIRPTRTGCADVDPQWICDMKNIVLEHKNGSR